MLFWWQLALQALGHPLATNQMDHLQKDSHQIPGVCVTNSLGPCLWFSGTVWIQIPWTPHCYVLFTARAWINFWLISGINFCSYSVLKSRDITLLTKLHTVKAMVFTIVRYGCKSWTIKKAEHWRTNAFKLWCWGRLLRVSWTACRSN